MEKTLVRGNQHQVVAGSAQMLYDIHGDPKQDTVGCVDGVLDDQRERIDSHRIVEGEQMLTERLDDFFFEFQEGLAELTVCDRASVFPSNQDGYDLREANVEEVKAIFGNIIQNEIHQHRAGLWHVALGQSAAVEAERSHRPYSSRMAMMSLLNVLSSGLMPVANSSWRSFL